MAGLLLVCVGLFAPIAQAATGPPLTAPDFVKAAPRGFEDRSNTWAWSMVWWRDHLYVGTNRQYLCTGLFAAWEYAVSLYGTTFANTFFPYPPKEPDLTCTPDAADLSLQAEIWRWSAGTNTWQRVFQSPLDLDNPGPWAPVPASQGKKLPYELGFRGLTVHTEPDGTEALYAFGVNTDYMWDRTKLPPPRILRSTDGVNWTPLPQTPGTFLGDLPFDPDHSSFRSAVSFNGMLFTLAGAVFGDGVLIGSADPAKGDNAWFLASPPGMKFFELEAFNGWLYLGGFDLFNGYSVLKTRAEGTPPYKFETVVDRGGYLPTRPSPSVVSMYPFGGRLYVGTSSMAELIRINPDDSWDVVVGAPRVVPTSTGGSELKHPISGLDVGFNNTFNDHIWRIQDHDGRLYLGTYNASSGYRFDPYFGPLMQHMMGFHLYRTSDGWYYTPVTMNGFADPSDPQGGRYDYGLRTMASTPLGLFLGTTNESYGQMIFRGTSPSSTPLQPAERLEIEPKTDGSALLSWEPSPGAASYQIWRAHLRREVFRDQVPPEGFNLQTGNKIIDWFPEPVQQIGVAREPVYVDSTVQPDNRYEYYVVADDGKGRVSEPSNLALFPLLTPPETFVQLSLDVDQMARRQRFLPGQDTRARVLVGQAQVAARLCQLDAAASVLGALRTATLAGTVVRAPEATDLEILVGKLIRRLRLYQRFPQVASTDELCTGTSVSAGGQQSAGFHVRLPLVITSRGQPR